MGSTFEYLVTIFVGEMVMHQWIEWGTHWGTGYQTPWFLDEELVHDVHAAGTAYIIAHDIPSGYD